MTWLKLSVDGAAAAVPGTDMARDRAASGRAPSRVVRFTCSPPWWPAPLPAGTGNAAVPTGTRPRPEPGHCSHTGRLARNAGRRIPGAPALRARAGSAHGPSALRLLLG